MDAPEILTVIDQIPHLADFLNSLHACNYKSFFQAFCKLKKATLPSVEVSKRITNLVSASVLPAVQVGWQRVTLHAASVPGVCKWSSA